MKRGGRCGCWDFAGGAGGAGRGGRRGGLEVFDGGGEAGANESGDDGEGAQ